MKRRFPLQFALVWLALPACSESGLSQGGGSDQSVVLDMAVTVQDLALPPKDLAKPPKDLAHAPVDFGGVQCGNTVCPGSQVCCYTFVNNQVMQMCANSCGDGGAPASCDGPEDCNGKFCCANLKVGSGTPPNCPIESAEASCTVSCFTALQQQCPSSEVMRLCHLDADCADDQANSNCCTLTSGSSKVTGCVSDTIKTFGMALGFASCPGI